MINVPAFKNCCLVIVHLVSIDGCILLFFSILLYPFLFCYDILLDDVLMFSELDAADNENLFSINLPGEIAKK